MCKHKNLAFPEHILKHETVHVICEISTEGGGEMIIQNTKPKWFDYCKIIPMCTPNGKRCLFFGDNAKWHTTDKTIGFIHNWGSKVCFGVAWQPFLNSIEMFFAIFRRKYNQLRLKDLMNGGITPRDDLLERAG